MVGGVLGALANEAEAARCRLEPDDQARLESIFVRLVRLGDTGGATRRTASLDEFDEAHQKLLRRLGEENDGRLIVVSEAKADIAHEALISQWPWLQGRLRDDKDDPRARDARLLDRLITKSRECGRVGRGQENSYLAAGAERESFDEIMTKRADWLSKLDRDFVEVSNRAYQSERESERHAREREQRAFLVARHNESVALTVLANLEAEKRPVIAAELALSAWPRDDDDKTTPKLAETLDALRRIVPNLRERRAFNADGEFAALSPNGKTIATPSDANSVRLWDVTSGREIASFLGHRGAVRSVAFSPDGLKIVTASKDGTARLWEAATGQGLRCSSMAHRSISLFSAPTESASSPQGTTRPRAYGMRSTGTN